LKRNVAPGKQQRPEEQLQEGCQTLSRGLIGFSVCLVFSFMTDKLWILYLYDIYFFSIYILIFLDYFTSSVM